MATTNPRTRLKAWLDENLISYTSNRKLEHGVCCLDCEYEPLIKLILSEFV